ncbi:MAG TPA: triose-phosphate isomerase [Candidatus Paceibacterota bacterium]
MANQKKLVVANWKMNPASVLEAKNLFSGVCRFASRLRTSLVIVCPPAAFLGDIRKSGSPKCAIGAQDVSSKNTTSGVGAYTGEVSSAMLVSLGVRYVIVGHSERRALGDSDEIVNQKVLSILRVGLTPILCIGEAVRDKEGDYLRFLQNELRTSLGSVKKADIAKVIIAYEPIWAVGKNAERLDTPDDLFEMTIFIRKTLGESYGRSIAMAIPILYGGSVDAKNVEALLVHGGIRGFLVGRASLDSKSFLEILKIVEHSPRRK